MDEPKTKRHARNKSRTKATGRKSERFCRWCLTTFRNYNKLINHVCLPNRCSLCDKSFKEELELKKHKINDHDYFLSKSGSSHLGSDGMSPDKKHYCKTCKKNLRGNHQFCTSCALTTSKDSDPNSSDDYSLISSATLTSSSNCSPLLNKTATAGKLFRRSRRISSSNSSRCSDSLGARENEDATDNEKGESLSVSLDKTSAHESRSRRSCRMNRFRSNSSEISRCSEALETEEADAIVTKNKASVNALNNTNMTSEKVSNHRCKRSTSSEVLKLSKSMDAQNVVDTLNDDSNNTQKKRSFKPSSSKAKKSVSLSPHVSKRNCISSNSPNVSESLEAKISKDVVSCNSLETESTNPILSETSIIGNCNGEFSDNSKKSNNSLDSEPLELQKSQDNINPSGIQAKQIDIQKPPEQHEKGETGATRKINNKTVSVLTKSSKQIDKLKKPQKTGNDIFNAVNLMLQKSNNVLKLKNQRNCPNESLSLKSNEQLVDLEGETTATSKVDKPAPMLSKPKRGRNLKNVQGQVSNGTVSKMGRKRNRESDDDNSVSPSRNKHDHSRRRTSKKTQNAEVVAPESRMVQIDTLIRSLPDDSGILLKPGGKDDSNFKCPKCNKVFRNPKLGSVHYSTCPKNIELSKNRRILISPCDVVWVCSLCHLNFNEHSKLTEHKKLCLLPTSSNMSFSSSLVGKKYKKCPKCCFECVSLIKFQNHPCEKNIRKMQSCAITIDKIALLEKPGKKSFQYLECQECNKLFVNKLLFKEHSQSHSQMQEGNILSIKTEIISLDDDEYADDSVQSTNDVTFNNPDITSSVSSDNHPQLNNSLHTNGSASSITNQQDNASSSFETFISPGPLPSFLNADSARMPSSQPNPSESQRGDIFSEAFLSSARESLGSGMDFLLTNRGICRCRGQAVPPEEDVKPCVRCLTEMMVNRDLSQNDPINIAKVKQEMTEAVQNTLDNREEGDALVIDDPPLPLNPDPPNPVHRDLDLGFSLPYGNSELTLQLLKDLHAIPTPPLSQRYPTPPVTPDQFNAQSPPSHGSAHRETRGRSGDFDCEAGPSGLNNSHSLNDLVSISLDLPFTTSEEFIARYNEEAQSHAVETLSVIANFHAAPEPPMVVAEPLSTAGESVPIAGTPDLVVGEPGIIADCPVPIEGEPGIIADCPVPIEGESVPIADEPMQIAEEYMPTVGEHVPTADEHLLTENEHVPTENEPVPIEDEHVSIANKLIPSAEELAPIADEVMQFAEQPVPIAEEPVLLGDEPVINERMPIVIEPVPIGDDLGLMVDQPMSMVNEPLAQDQLEYEMLDSPTIQHRHVTFGELVADVFAIIPDFESETVDRYICRHCLMPFQLDGLMTHMYTELGKPTTEDIIAVYIAT